MSAASPPGRLHTFFVVKEPGKAQRILVFDTQDISLGRAGENDVAIDHGEISRRHAVFQKLQNGCIVKNLSGSNSTLVNGSAVDTHTLRTKDVVRVAEVEFVFYQVPKNPVTLGAEVEYASQLKNFGPSGGAGSSPEATMLGLMDEVSGGGDEFQVGPASDFAYDLHGMDGDGDAAPAPRNLDLELEPPEIEPPGSPAPAPAAPARDQVWTLDDATDPGKGSAGPLSLHVQLEGLSPDLRRLLEGLLGKTLELPPLRVRLRSDDLD